MIGSTPQCFGKSVAWVLPTKKWFGLWFGLGVIDGFRGRSPRYGLVVELGFNSNRYGVASRLSGTLCRFAQRGRLKTAKCSVGFAHEKTVRIMVRFGG